MRNQLNDLFNRILAGDRGLLQGFGLVRVTSCGSMTPSGIYEWDNRTEITGEGRVSFTMRRSLSDMPGREAGVYEMQKDQGFVLDLVRQLTNCRLDELAASHVEPLDVMIRLEVVCGGVMFERAMSARDRSVTAAIRPLLDLLTPLAEELEQHALLSLAVSLAGPTRMREGETDLNLALTFWNSGTQGYWLPHPATLSGEMNVCELIYGRKPVVRQDIMPQPLVLLRAPLTAAEASLDAIWMPAGGQAMVACRTRVNSGSPGRMFMRAAYASYVYTPRFGAQPCFAGAVFSEDIEIDVT